MTDNAHALQNKKGKRLRKGHVYLRLLHGRNDPDEPLSDWGFNGPTFGPLTSVAMTYLTTIRLYGLNGTDELWLDTTQDMVLWESDYYGDYEVFAAGPNDVA